MKKVLIPTKLDKVAQEILTANGNYEVVQEESEDLEGLAKQNPDAYAMIVRSNKVTPEIIDALPAALAELHADRVSDVVGTLEFDKPTASSA